jgi:hypothetical protein
MTMRSISRILAFVLMGILLSLPALGADDKDKKADTKKQDTAKKDDAKKDDAKKSDAKKDSEKEKDTPPAEKMVKVGTVRGKIVWLDEAKKKLKLEVPAGNQKVEYEWQAMDDVKVRSANPPVQFDEKGRVKKLTAKEKKELKGNDKLPGYPAEFSDLKREQIVDVSLVSKKPPARAKKGTLGAEYTPKMSFIMILTQPSP